MPRNVDARFSRGKKVKASMDLFRLEGILIFHGNVQEFRPFQEKEAVMSFSTNGNGHTTGRNEQRFVTQTLNKILR